MRWQQIHMKIDTPLLRATEHLARERDITVGQVVRDALAAELRRVRRNAKTPVRADERLLAPLRALLAADMAAAKTWLDLQNKLKSKGYELREAGGGLAMYSFPEGARLCKASELGASYATLMRRFKAPFPGHAHRHLVDRVLETTPQTGDGIAPPNTKRAARRRL